MFANLPKEKLPYNRKSKKWREDHLRWASTFSIKTNNNTRNTFKNKKINYDLLNGVIHMEDLKEILNPEGLEGTYVPEKIHHYPIINSKINVLRGEEINRVFDYKIIVTNPNAISSIEEEKKSKVIELLNEFISSSSNSKEEEIQKLQKITDYFNFEYQDMRAQRAEYLLNHYNKELCLNNIFNEGFTDVLVTNEEIYQIEIISGEPTVRKINPNKIHIFRTGNSEKIEDADIIVLEDYLSPNQIIDHYYDKLSDNDISKLEKLQYSFEDKTTIDDTSYRMYGGNNLKETLYFDENTDNGEISNQLPSDYDGNIRVISMYWKSKKKIKKIKRYNTKTGDPEFVFRSEFYNVRKDLGEEEEIFWISEAWHGTLIADDIFCDINPCKIQYNRLSNPSRCHFGIVGTIYTLNNSKPFSLVDMMKPYSYLYDAISDRMNKCIEHNWGTLINLDLSKIPHGWEIEKALYYAKTAGIFVTDSFKEGEFGKATGVLAGAMNNTTSVIQASSINEIQQYIQLLQYIKSEMSEIVGITPQREGQISNRETVGGIEHATTQSSHITEYLFSKHDDTKKRVLECLLETSKYCLRSQSKKFQYILPDGALKICEIEGDKFAECDFGIILDNSINTQTLNQSIETFAQAGLQNGLVNLSTLLKIYNTTSISEKQRILENYEKQQQQQKEQELQQQQQIQQQQVQAQQQQIQVQQEHELKIAKLKTDTQLEIAKLNSNTTIQNTNIKVEADSKIKEGEQKLIEEDARQFNIKTNNDINKTLIKANAKLAAK